MTQSIVQQPVQFINTDLADVIELKNIHQKYADNITGEDKIIIDGLNLLIEDKPSQGEFVVLLGQSGCVDKDTEFFNGIEWKSISKYNDSDKVLQYNEDGTSQLVTPLDYIKLPSKRLNHIQTSRGLDMCICDDHRVIYKNRKYPNKLYEITGSELVHRQSNTKNGMSIQIPTTFSYSGNGLDLSDDEIKLMVAAIADGHFRTNTNLCRFNLKKSRKKDRLRNIISNLELESTIHSKGNGFDEFYIRVPMNQKEYTSDWYNASYQQLKLIADESLLWDGSTVNGRNYVSTTSKQTADFIQFAFSSTGRRATISINDRRGQPLNQNGKIYIRKSIEYKVVISNNDCVGMYNNKGNSRPDFVDYLPLDSYKYCFTVPSSMLVLRRNNKIFITGNCGKSTVLRYIAGLQEPTSGEILINGKPREKDFRAGMVFQQYSSFPWLSVLENVAIGLELKGISKKERNDRAMEMIQKVGLEGHEHKYAQYPILSGGQLQRVAIARSLVSSPNILLMDEPFGALDINTRLQMQDMLASIWEEMRPTIIFVTHDIPEAVYLGDDIYVMGRNPGNIRHHIPVPLPANRTSDLKRSPQFNKLVYDIEDMMMAL
jgi:NitT/TauT family transport system ATP-binding protein